MTKWVIKCVCRVDSLELVANEFLDMYLYCETSYHPEDGTVIICSQELDYNPIEDNTEASADFDIFLDAIRKYANYGWPDHDPVEIVKIVDKNFRFYNARHVVWACIAEKGA